MKNETIFNKIIFIRHGQSLSNIENRFTGWLDVDLTTKGYNEAYMVGIKLKNLNYKFDICYTSVLKRAIRTTWAILDGMNSIYTPIITSPYLNERHYGKLSGFNKSEGVKIFGKENIISWLNSYNSSPPALDINDIRNPHKKPQYINFPKNEIPLTECLQDTLKRVLKIWNENIISDLKKKKNLLVVGHSNLLRVLIKYLDKGIEDKIELIPNTVPIVYEFDKNLKKIKSYII